MIWVIHVMGGTWCMFNPWIFPNGFENGRWFAMNLHIGDGLFSGFSTLVGFLLSVLPSGIGVLLIAWVTSFMMSTWTWLLACRRPFLGGG